MLRVAICDDDKALCMQLKGMIDEIIENTDEVYEITVFCTGEELCDLLYNGIHYDIIFLDIELCEINGVEVGKKIREELNDELTQIVYISAKESYAMDLFDIRPLNFLVKPLKREKIESVFITARKVLGSSNQYYEYKVGNVNLNVIINDILYFESSGRKVKIILKDDVTEYYGKLSEVEEKLKNSDFFFIHKSYFINYNHVIEYSYEYVKMSNNEILGISQNNRKAVREKLLQKKQRMHHVK
jgi:DNA-binding LytR/AlgR family response regulator